MISNAIILALVGLAYAPATDGEASASISAGSGGIKTASSGDAKPPSSQRWIKRHAPRAGTFELGVFGGVLLPASDIELHRPTLPQKSFSAAAPEIGFRAGYYPLRFFGMEGELAVMPTATADDERAVLYSARAQGVLQLGLWSVTPFLVAGGGVLAVSSDDAAVGNNADEAFHFGGGLKIFFHRNVGLRLDVRDVLTPRLDEPSRAAHNVEALLGLSVPLGPWKRPVVAPPPPADRDADGVPDDVDVCPTKAGTQEDGCPIPDFDSDGVPDAEDACPCEASAEADGCPIRDTDGDGFDDPVDRCPGEAGIAPDGCPDPDPDSDGVQGEADKCPNQPETVNGFEDSDGCPDEVPAEIAKFTGVIEGIYFETGKSDIADKSRATLSEAAEVLTKYSALRVEVSGHTDNRGKEAKNRTLSAARAEAVKRYMLEHGVLPEQIETRGAGPDSPIGDNATKAGRAKNRRIEFKLLR
ncbi:MAG: OmpA family protein [Nannocystaceae bacterium]|nr:OmpA family protein [Nannocystaceae bacterium]